MKNKKIFLIGFLVLIIIPLCLSINNSIGNPIPGPVPDYPHTVEITSPYMGQGIPYTTTEITFSGISITEELDEGIEYYYTYTWFSLMGFYVNDSGSKYTDNNGILTIIDMDFVFDEIASYPNETDQYLTLEVTIFEDSGHVWELSASQSTNIWFRGTTTNESDLNIVLIISALVIVGTIATVSKRKTENPRKKPATRSSVREGHV